MSAQQMQSYRVDLLAELFLLSACISQEGACQCNLRRFCFLSRWETVQSCVDAKPTVNIGVVSLLLVSCGKTRRANPPEIINTYSFTWVLAHLPAAPTPNSS